MLTFKKVPLVVLLCLCVVVTLYGCEPDTVSGKSANFSPEINFQIPADGRLTEKQITDYIIIRQSIIRDVRAQKLAKQQTLAELAEDSSESPDDRYFDDIEKRAALTHNMSYDEFVWVKDTIISTHTKLLVQHYYDLNNKIMTLLDKTLIRYEELNSVKPDHQEQKKMQGYVAEMKQEMAKLNEKISDVKDRPQALQHNMALVAKFQDELEALEQQVLQENKL